MNEKNSGTQNGMTFIGWLQLALIILKIVGIIDWSWLVVLSPLILCVAIVAAAALAVIVLTGGN